MTSVITGVAGFIGSTLADTLLEAGESVIGIDCFTPYYDPAAKRRNLEAALSNPAFQLVEGDLCTLDLVDLFSGPDAGGVDVVYHQAGQPGVRLSWSDGFEEYARLNVVATQRLLEAAKAARVPRVVYASSSSLYGNATNYPTTELDLPAPHSPYGVTKLAAEHLCNLYAANWGLSTVSLRYFTVYGPRQRPDMAIHRMVESALSGSPFPLFGDGSAVRDFTFVGDAVAANIAAGRADVAPGTVVNIAGGGDIRVSELIDLVGATTGDPVPVERHEPVAGDVARTGGTIDRAAELLGWTPERSIADGVAAQVAWHRVAGPAAVHREVELPLAG